MNQKVIKNTMTLTAITLISGLLLGFVYEVTKRPIAESRARSRQEAYRNAFAGADSFEAFPAFDSDSARKLMEENGMESCRITDAAVAFDGGKEKVGYVVSAVSREGYGGEIELSVGIAEDGTVMGVEFLSIGETAGLGMNAAEPEFKGQFQNVKTEAFQVVKGGAAEEGEIAALSGATITSKAVTGAVNASLVYWEKVLEGGGLDE